MKKMFKYSFEAGLYVENCENILFPVSALNSFNIRDFPEFHLYCIVAFHKLYFDHNSLTITKTTFQVKLFYMLEGKKTFLNTPYPFAFSEDVETIECPFPHNKVLIKYKDGYIDAITAQELFLLHMEQFEKKPHFEILYIGQAYGEGDRSAIERLQAHSTLQEILTKTTTEYSEKDIYLLLISINTSLLMGFNGIDKEFIKSEEESQNHMKEVLTHENKEKQIINITEAALIHYFKPPYNVTFKENFPCKNHTSYKDYYTLDYSEYRFSFKSIKISGATIELFTATARQPGPFDTINYKLDNNPNRKSMYDIFTV